MQELYELVKENPGTVPLVFEVHTNGNGEGLTMRSKKYRVLLTDGFIQKLYSILGKNAVKIGN